MTTQDLFEDLKRKMIAKDIVSTCAKCGHPQVIVELIHSRSNERPVVNIRGSLRCLRLVSQPRGADRCENDHAREWPLPEKA